MNHSALSCALGNPSLLSLVETDLLHGSTCSLIGMLHRYFRELPSHGRAGMFLYKRRMDILPRCVSWMGRLFGKTTISFSFNKDVLR